MVTNVDIYLDRFEAHEKRISPLEDHQRVIARREIIQFVAGVVVIVVSIFGAGGFLGWQSAQLNVQLMAQNAQLVAQIEKRIDQLEKRIEQNERHSDARMEDLRRDLTARFDELKQIVISQKK